jgi:hypothetical protein
MVRSKLVSIEYVLNATTKRQQEFDQEFLQTSKVDGNASAFGVMLEDLLSRVPSPLMLQQSDDLLAFIRYTSQATYLELQKVGKFPASGSAILSLEGQFSERLVACDVVAPFCVECTNHSASSRACNGNPNHRLEDL